MKRVLLLSCVIFSFLNFSKGTDYSTKIVINENLIESHIGNYPEAIFRSIEDKFEISLSCDPEIIEESVDNMLYGTYTLVRYLGQGSDEGIVISVSRYPQSFLNIYDEKETVKGCFTGYETAFNISIKTVDYKIDGKVGQIAKFYANDVYWVAVAVFNKGRLFQIIKVGMNDYPSDSELNQFMSSFKTF